jgi:hypothetical protein
MRRWYELPRFNRTNGGHSRHAGRNHSRSGERGKLASHVVYNARVVPDEHSVVTVRRDGDTAGKASVEMYLVCQERT